MTRTAAREIAVMLCFSELMNPVEDVSRDFFEDTYYSSLASEDDIFSDRPGAAEIEYIERLLFGVANEREELDSYIGKYSNAWKLDRISRIASTIMRVCMFEVLHMADIPDSASINEAVEIAKGYEEPETVSFINGILGSFYRAEIEKSDAE